MKKLSTFSSNTDNIMGALDTFQTPQAEDGICNHCGKYDSELTKDGYCRQVEFPTPGEDDCWHVRLIAALESGTARFLKDGTLLWLQGLEG